MTVRVPSLEPVLYTVYSAACTLAVGIIFFRSMRQQITMLYASLTGDPLLRDLVELGPWSAPLDDVFIHFDFARATARGFPFQWSEGNGYSSGGTSLTYPFVLAIGYWAGFVDLHLVLWAALVGAASVLGLLLAVRCLFVSLPRATTYLAPPFLLATGVLDWALWSGMEVAFFLGVWGLSLLAWSALVAAAETPVRPLLARATVLGLTGACVVATRPEAATTVAIFATSAAYVALRRRGWSLAARILALAGIPGAAILLLHALANLAYTGELSAAGAVSKLEAHDPFRGPTEILDSWLFFVRYQVERITHYHFSENGRHGVIVWILALVALVPKATQRYALLLWASAASWVAIVAFNGQVRWQNERYAMPAVAWLLLAAALGAAAMISLPRGAARRAWWLRVAAVGTVGAAIGLFAWQEVPRFREQVWFFGRASRNVLEQHVRVGLVLRDAVEPRPKRIAVGDAGAIPYVADLPALDLIGLGGYRRLPFGRAKRHGLGAVVELLERMPPDERPDVFALYPSWWDVFPIWFGRGFGEVPVHGNVICAGAAKVLYRADYGAFDGSARPAGLGAQEQVTDEVDIADLVSERAHRYGASPRIGHVDMKILAHPERPSSELWDGGRLIPPGGTERFVVRGIRPGRPFAVVLRMAPTRPVKVSLSVGGWQGTLEVQADDAWQHPRLVVPAAASVGEEVEVTVRADTERVSYHLWVVSWP
ncbi:MAG: hypothetical protein JW751_06005 [Polyangiaceae bacterium]|nr:hypothetical protein [Polyangiaceae bacterium]